MKKEDFLHMLNDDLSDSKTNSAATLNKIEREDEKARLHIALFSRDKRAMLLTSLNISSAVTKKLWQRLPDSYQKENI